MKAPVLYLDTRGSFYKSRLRDLTEVGYTKGVRKKNVQQLNLIDGKS